MKNKLKELNERIAEVGSKELLMALGIMKSKSSEPIAKNGSVTIHLNHLCLLAHKENKVVGICIPKDVIDYGHPGVTNIVSLYVLPEYRKSGIGRALTMAALMLAFERCGDKACLITSPDGESDSFRHMMLKLGARELVHKNVLDLPLLFIGLKGTEDKLTVKKEHTLEYYIDEGENFLKKREKLKYFTVEQLCNISQSI